MARLIASGMVKELKIDIHFYVLKIDNPQPSSKY